MNDVGLVQKVWQLQTCTDQAFQVNTGPNTILLINKNFYFSYVFRISHKNSGITALDTFDTSTPHFYTEFHLE